MTQKLIRVLRPVLDRHPAVKDVLRQADLGLGRARHRIAEHVPGVIQPRPRQLTVAVTAKCNLRCEGCRYGRDFMVGERISMPTMLEILEDARAAGIPTLRLYGGEPLTHPDLAAMVAAAVRLGFGTYVTTNGLLLGTKINELHAAGLRDVTVGFYGSDGDGSGYTGLRLYLEKLDRSLRRVRERHGADMRLQLNYVLLRPFCSLEALGATWDFAQRHGMAFHVDLVSWSVPFFANGVEKGLQFEEQDRPLLNAVSEELVRLKTRHPELIRHSATFLRSIPDWLILRERMRVPCDAYELLWIGADGTVQLCDTAFPLGNVRHQRLRDILFGEAHRKAARDGFRLDCPNCICKAEPRIQKHAPSMAKYGAG